MIRLIGHAEGGGERETEEYMRMLQVPTNG